MTAEICILNREAVAMVSDSAATVELTTPDGKIYEYFPTVDKIFKVGSDVHTIGVMIYQSPTIMEVPWETLIKLWGDTLEDRPLPRLSDYADSLLAFVRSHSVIKAADQQEHHFARRSSFSPPRCSVLWKHRSGRNSNFRVRSRRRAGARSPARSSMRSATAGSGWMS